jgi:hypothetical protein
MDNPLASLEIIRSQRDGLAVAYHDLQVEHTLLKEALKRTNELLEIARGRVTELETPATAQVEIASDADTDAAA